MGELERIFEEFGEQIRHYNLEKENPFLSELRIKEGLSYISPNVIFCNSFRKNCFYDGAVLNVERLEKTDEPGRNGSYFSCPVCNLVYILPFGVKSNDSFELVEGLLNELFGNSD